MKEALTNYRRIMMAMEDAAREKQVNVQVDRLNKAVEALQENYVRLVTSLGAVLSSERSEEDQDKEAQIQLCEHADFLYTKVSEIAKVAYDLGELIKRLEI